MGKATHQYMNVIWHDDVVTQRVALAIEMMKGVRNYFRQFAISQETFTLARIECLLQFHRKGPGELLSIN